MKKNTTRAIAAIITMAATLPTHAQLVKFAPYTYVSLSKAGMNAAAPDYVLYASTTPENNNFDSIASFTLPTTATEALNINGVGLNALDSLMYGA